MKLMTKAIEEKIPNLYETEEIADKDKRVYAKFFHPASSWTWDALEYDPKDKMFYGLVNGYVKELGYFSLQELEEVSGPMGIRIERDKYWNDSTTLSEVYSGVAL